MSKHPKILFVHHGGVRGGGVLSLLYLLRRISNNYSCEVVNTRCSDEVQELFDKEGIPSISKRICRFPHTTGGGLSPFRIEDWRFLIGWHGKFKASIKRLIDLVERYEPDIVHLNSLTLAPYIPHLKRRNVIVVTHVREAVLPGYFGIRRAWLRKCLLASDHIIAISKDSCTRLALPRSKCSIVYNPVDMKQFNRSIDKDKSRDYLGIPINSKAVLFPGGSMNSIKGMDSFLKAIGIIANKKENLICMMPSFSPPPERNTRSISMKHIVAWILGMYRRENIIRALLKVNKLRSLLVCNEFSSEIQIWYSACDVVCIPHIKPHFSRAIEEAGSMARPIVAHRIGGVEEVVKDGITGILVETGDVNELANSIMYILNNKQFADNCGEAGFAQAKTLFSLDISADAVEDIYLKVLNNE